MEITEIKQRLTLPMVINHYGQKADNSRPVSTACSTKIKRRVCCCTIAYCFSANCKTHGKTMDVIDLIIHKENTGKHKAIEKAKSLMDNGQLKMNNENKLSTVHYPLPIDRTQFLGNTFHYFRNAISNSQPTKEYVKRRN